MRYLYLLALVAGCAVSEGHDMTFRERAEIEMKALEERIGNGDTSAYFEAWWDGPRTRPRSFVEAMADSALAYGDPRALTRIPRRPYETEPDWVVRQWEGMQIMNSQREESLSQAEGEEAESIRRQIDRRLEFQLGMIERWKELAREGNPTALEIVHRLNLDLSTT